MKLPEIKRTVYHLTKYGVVLRSNAIPPSLRGHIQIAIGSGKRGDSRLYLVTDEQAHETVQVQPREGYIQIDETWRKGNNEPILFSDYLKMTSNVIQDTEGLVMAQAKMKVANKIEEIREKAKENELESPENNIFSRSLCTCYTNSNYNCRNFTCHRCKGLRCINCVKRCTSCEGIFCSACLILGEYKKYNKCYPCSGRVGFYG